MYCHYCGKEIGDESNYCTYCGARLLNSKKDKILGDIPQNKNKGIKMGISSRELEEKLFQEYVESFINIGMSRSDATPIVTDMLKLAKENSKKGKTNNFPQNFGNIIIENDKRYPEVSALVKKARREGATDNDIKEWWNLHDLERYMIRVYDNHSQLVSFINGLESGKSEEEAAKGVKKFFPIYGDPDDTSKSIGDDRPLPYELKSRVNRYNERVQRQDPYGRDFKKKIDSYTTFNALIRAEIRIGNV